MRKDLKVLNYVSDIINITSVKHAILSSAHKVNAYNKILDVEEQIGTYLGDYGALMYLLSSLLDCKHHEGRGFAITANTY